MVTISLTQNEADRLSRHLFNLEKPGSHLTRAVVRSILEKLEYAERSASADETETEEG